MVFIGTKRFLTALAVSYSVGVASAASEFPPLDTTVGDAVADRPKKGCFRLTPARDGKTGAVWASGKIDLTKRFQFVTDVYVGANDDGADGIAFVLQNNSVNAIGGGGKGQGFSGIKNALVVELDTWPNNKKEEKGDFLQVSYSDDKAQFKKLSKMAFVENVEDDNKHQLKVSWDGSELKIWLDRLRGKPKITLPLPEGLSKYVGGSSEAYYGYTAATGKASNMHYICKKRSVVRGDPHFRTWSGEKYDFHGVCDLVLFQSPTMDIHIRTQRTRMWSYIHSAAVRVGDDILEVMGGADENRFWVNKVSGETGMPISFSLDGHPVTFNQLSSKSRQFVIDLGNGDDIEIKTFNGMVSLTMNGESGSHFHNSLGLMGTYPDGLKLARDNSTVIEDFNAFGQEWQVQPAQPILFHDVQGPQYPDKCEIPTTTNMRRRLGATTISKEDAIMACSRVSEEDFDLCVFDVMATNDKASAGAY